MTSPLVSALPAATARGKKIRVLVVDDSALVRRAVTDALGKDPGIEVVGTAIDPFAAREKILALDPDVLTLDIEMPRMDGLTFLKILMRHRPLPVIIMSSLTQAGSDRALEALQAGAVEVLGKPDGAYSVGELADELAAKVRAAAAAVRRTPPAPARPTSLVTTNAAPRPVVAVPRARQLILLGASTGGTEALRDVLTRLPAGLPGIAIVQHIPALFSRAFAERLNTLCAFEVREAADGDRLRPGLALVAPGNHHLLLRWDGEGYRARLNQGPKLWHQRPAVDALFRSVLDGAGPHLLAGLLTGMGKDGAEGLLRLREAGARTFAQDEASCVVFGMPRAARDLGAAEAMVPLDQVSEHLLAGVAAAAVGRG